MRPKDIKACIFFLIFSAVIWQFGEVIKSICLKPNHEVLNNILFSITYSQNTGAAWSFFQDKTGFLVCASILVLIIMMIYVYIEVSFKNKIELLSISIISGGILGNLLERVHFGYVIDYIKLNFINFPVFNMFDVMVCGGIILYVLGEFYNEIKKKNDKKNN